MSEKPSEEQPTPESEDQPSRNVDTPRTDVVEKDRASGHSDAPATEVKVDAPQSDTVDLSKPGTTEDPESSISEND